MNVTQELVFVWSTAGIVIGVAAVATTAVLCWLAWQRSGFAKATGFLEAVRLLLVVLVPAARVESKRLHLPPRMGNLVWV